jgi:hypothetical protein
MLTARWKATSLHGHSLIIGPTGRVRAKVDAREVVVHGELHGNVRGTERVELKKTAVLVGDVVTQRTMIEDGAHFKGSIDIQRQAAETRHGSDQGSSGRVHSGALRGGRKLRGGLHPSSAAGAEKILTARPCSIHGSGRLGHLPATRRRITECPSA